ncbi:hypothetical protein K378_05163 [Streptomyces sp. Amel2xB2]|uniref:DUF2264 domain-containing protein n=1 Tax=Streptomyces sp. Amel2xB2 TaxID=1305829 RepID=UPI000DB9A0AB|nr:DUF2264 domain-containing protein [Streptomyces sp. Amel2xB2]RAJ58283.1 hypothetical protein K378_05163 [Streptomyces sp. Amel2xB2]
MTATPAAAAHVPLRLPPEDREFSPFTGWTRAHWEATADGLLTAARRFATPGGALLDLPGRPSRTGVRSDGLEGYARTFLAAAFRVAGARGADPHGFLQQYADGLAAGTRTPGRDDAESWPPVLDHTVYGQPMVESASVALGLRLTRPWLWDRLDDAVRDRAEEWLRGALRHVPAPNNWYLFPLTVGGFLESVGRGDETTRRAVRRGLELLEGWYAGEGWYSDGDGRAFDHYNGWALHLYPLLHARLAGESAESERLGARLRAHLDGFALLFDGNGAPLHFGRSLTYRFAANSAVALGALTGHTPLGPGVSRRLLSGCTRYFLDRGALGRDGVLTLGWHGPHEATLQDYSGPASPYWASKGLLPLLVPEDDPLWTAREEAAPSEGPPRALALPSAGLLIQTGGYGGPVRLHNHGSDHVPPHEGESAHAEDPLYARLAYSTRTGPTASGNVPDNHLAVEVPGPHGTPVRSARLRIRPLGAASEPDGAWGWAASWHTPVFPSGGPMVPGLRVQSVTYVRGGLELRVHRVVGAPPGTRVRLTGWATGEPEEGAAVETAAGAETTAGGLHGLYGWDEETPVLLRAPQGTAFTRWARVPALTGDAEGTALFAALATLTARTVPGAAPPQPPEQARAERESEAEAATKAGAGAALDDLSGAARLLSADAASLAVRWSADGTVTRVAFGADTAEVTTSAAPPPTP